MIYSNGRPPHIFRRFINSKKQNGSLLVLRSLSSRHYHYRKYGRLGSIVAASASGFILISLATGQTSDCENSNGNLKEDTSYALLGNKEYAKGNKGNNTTKTVSVLSSSNSAVLSEHHNIHSQKYQPLAACIIKLLQQVKEDVGAPGLSYSISVDGEDVMSGGLGFADVENGTYCTDETVMRIASISKSLTSVAAGRLIETGKLDIDVPVSKYYPDFPIKTWEEEEMNITMRQVLSHTSGLRGYFNTEEPTSGLKVLSTKDQILEKAQKNHPESEIRENYNKNHYKSTEAGLAFFKDDPLLYKPGTDYLYSTHAYTLASVVIEKISNMKFADHMNILLKEMGMGTTMVDLNDPLVYNRSRNYVRDSRGRLKNVPYVDNSYKWAGGGYLSTVKDLSVFGNTMLKCYQGQANGILQQSTVDLLWTAEPVTVGKCVSKHDTSTGYGLGWFVTSKKDSTSSDKDKIVYHTGGAVGASSILLIHPSTSREEGTLPRGTVIALIVNMHKVSLLNLAHTIDERIKEFQRSTSKNG